MNMLQDILKTILKKWFIHYFYVFLSFENVEKMITYGDPAFSGAMHGCPHCGGLEFVPFRRNSCFCPACSSLYAIQLATSMFFKFFNVLHRHCVFAIDEQWCYFFLDACSFLDCLFPVVNDVVSCKFVKHNNSMNFTSYLIMVLHIFGRDLKCVVMK